MARKRRRQSNDRQPAGRDAAAVARRQPAPADPFNEQWLARIRERPSIPFVDLTRVEDRRFYHPSMLGPDNPPKTLWGGRPRIVVVPEGHRLAKYQTYGGRFTLDEVMRKQGQYPQRRRTGWQKSVWSYGPKNNYPHVRSYTYGEHVPRQIGFALPWQVIVCVRRKRRRQVLHAIGKTGRGQVKQRRPRRNYYSEVRC